MYFSKNYLTKIGEKFCGLIKSLYSNSKCAVRCGKTRTPFFSYSKGVRQGCIICPMLFNIYINEVATPFDNALSDPFILPNATKLSCLMYADDLVILSRSKFGLQRCLHQFNGWCNKWMMQINLKKTKIMIFQKITRKNSAQQNFFLVDNYVCITKAYCYPGNKLTSNGKFTIALQQLAEKALHALQSIRNQLDFHLVYPKLAIKIFDNIISPILFYNSEV